MRKATLASVLARAAPGLRLRPKRRDLRAGADQLWIELGINRLADAGTAANDALAASITAMRTSSLSTSTTHGLGELIAVVRECADAAATVGRLGRPHLSHTIDVPRFLGSLPYRSTIVLYRPRSPQCAHRPCPPRPLMAWAS